MSNDQTCSSIGANGAVELLAGVSYDNRHAFTVDVEEWFQVGAYENVIDESDWCSLESRIDYQVSLLLDLLNKHSVKATFFSLGYVAQNTPAVIKKIATEGHEIACHGLDHKRLFTLDIDEFKRSTLDAKTRLEDIIGIGVMGYRAPSFSLTKNVWWVYGELEQMGFKYSSSIYPVKHDHYGMREAPRTPFKPYADASIIEIPMTVATKFGRALPASGGGYFRLMPYGVAKRLFNMALKQNNVPGIFYTHPWEYDPEQPRVKGASYKSSFRHHVGQKHMEVKVSRFLSDFEWGTMRDVIYHPIAEQMSTRP
jgi:polysaccharide deacetylase family protein (PEP-CTERM system associated)